MNGAGNDIGTALVGSGATRSLENPHVVAEVWIGAYGEGSGGGAAVGGVVGCTGRGASSQASNVPRARRTQGEGLAAERAADPAVEPAGLGATGGDAPADVGAPAAPSAPADAEAASQEREGVQWRIVGV